MLGKLLKYEYKSTARVFLPVYVLVIVFSILSRLFNELNTKFDSAIITIPSALFMLFMVILLAGIVILTFIVFIQRFYKNLIGDEGYLMFTLPVKPINLIISKLITAMTWIIGSTVVGLLSVTILSISKTVISEIEEFMSHVPPDVWQIIPFGVVLLIIATATGVMMFYAAMSIGQCVTGHKVIGAIGGYWGLYAVNQIITTVIVLILSRVVNMSIFNVNTLEEFVGSAMGVVQVGATLLCVYNIVWAVLYGLISNYVFKRKINLE
jgi:hypothetical protein